MAKENDYKEEGDREEGIKKVKENNDEWGKREKEMKMAKKYSEKEEEYNNEKN